MPTSNSVIRYIIVTIHFEKIGQGIGVCLAIYSYSKIGIVNSKTILYTRWSLLIIISYD